MERFLVFEATFDSQVMIDYTREHSEIPVFAVGVYLWFIFQLPELLPRPFKLRRLFVVWNLLLALFSITGASRVVPTLLRALSDPAHGATLSERFLYTCCTDPAEWYLRGPAGLWMGLFIYSKFPELLDTVRGGARRLGIESNRTSRRPFHPTRRRPASYNNAAKTGVIPPFPPAGSLVRRAHAYRPDLTSFRRRSSCSRRRR